VRTRRLPADFVEKLALGLEGKADATRKHSGTVIGRIAVAAPGLLIGGSADLAGSNNTTIASGGAIGQGNDPFAGANVHFGVREHAMGAITNGIALDGTFLPFAGTFLVFSDYMRPSLRLAALMRARSTFVFTHDSIFVGEDGPTHQPVEQLDALRAIPGLTVIRPADAVEAALAWAWVVERARGPVALALSRQTVPALKREAAFSPELFWRGAYVVREPGGEPDVALLASGSEVSLAFASAELLSGDGIAARVLSVPSLEWLAAQPPALRDELLPPGLPLVAVEAGRGESWRGLVGREGLVYGIERFGASAPYQKLAEHFGFTPDALARRVREHLRG
jgi:transketolase